MKVGHVTERGDSCVAPSLLDSEEQERSGTDLGNTGRLQLMAQLSEGETISLHLQENKAQISQFSYCSSVCTRVLPVNRYEPSDASYTSAGSADEWSDCYRSNGGSFRSVALLFN